MRSISAAIIIIFFPFLVSAHGESPQFDVLGGILPGQKTYFFKTAREWLDLNLFTISTKAKQARRLSLAGQRLAEIRALLTTDQATDKDYQEALAGYKTYLDSAEDMAEKIIFLDGAEIGIARDFETRTRLHEQVISELLEETPHNQHLKAALRTARLANQGIFVFMVTKYQFTDADIKIHQAILAEGMAYIRERTTDKSILKLLTEAEKYRQAGLNLKAYAIILRATVTLDSKL